LSNYYSIVLSFTAVYTSSELLIQSLTASAKISLLGSSISYPNASAKKSVIVVWRSEAVDSALAYLSLAIYSFVSSVNR